MAKTSSIENNKKRERLTKQYAVRRQVLKDLIMNADTPMEERFTAQMKLAQLPRNSSKTRVRLRCLLTGRARGNYQKFKLSRLSLRKLASNGQIPGMVKASW